MTFGAWSVIAFKIAAVCESAPKTIAAFTIVMIYGRLSLTSLFWQDADSKPSRSWNNEWNHATIKALACSRGQKLPSGNKKIPLFTFCTCVHERLVQLVALENSKQPLFTWSRVHIENINKWRMSVGCHKRFVLTIILFQTMNIRFSHAVPCANP